jgi:phosphoglycerate dehydrogenase-like enzyme
VNILVSIHSGFRMWTIPPEYVDRLRARFPDHRFLHARNDEEAGHLIAAADAAFSGYVHPAQLQAARRLRWIHSPSAGVGHMLYPEMVASPVIMTNARGLSADTIAEHVLALVFALFRRLPLAFERQGQRIWAQDEMVAHATSGVPVTSADRDSPLPANRTVAGATVLVVGLGGIGRAAAARFAALGATVTGVRRHADAPLPPGVTSVHPLSAFHDLLPAADVVVLTAPQTAATRNMVGAPELALLKETAVIINVSRGALIDEQALADALRRRVIAAAALDVFRDEPLGPAHELWTVPNLLITPHYAGFRSDHWQAATDLFAENLRRFDKGEPLINVVDKGEGY